MLRGFTASTAGTGCLQPPGTRRPECLGSRPPWADGSCALPVPAGHPIRRGRAAGKAPGGHLAIVAFHRSRDGCSTNATVIGHRSDEKAAMEGSGAGRPRSVRSPKAGWALTGAKTRPSLQFQEHRPISRHAGSAVSRTTSHSDPASSVRRSPGRPPTACPKMSRSAWVKGGLSRQKRTPPRVTGHRHVRGRGAAFILPRRQPAVAPKFRNSVARLLRPASCTASLARFRRRTWPPNRWGVSQRLPGCPWPWESVCVEHSHVGRRKHSISPWQGH